MPITIDIFLWVNGIIFAVLIAMFVCLYTLRLDLKPLTSLVKTIDDWLRKKGLNGAFIGGDEQTKASHHSLSPEKAARRDLLLQLSRTYGLTDLEANELQALLQEDARDDFNRGILSLLAFAAIMLAIGAIIRSLSRR